MSVVKKIEPNKRTEIKLDADQQFVLRGQKLTDPAEDILAAVDIVLTAMPYDENELRVNFGNNGTYKSLVVSVKSIMYRGIADIINSGDTFSAGEHEISFSSDCGDPALDREVTIKLGLYPGRKLITVFYTVEAATVELDTEK